MLRLYVQVLAVLAFPFAVPTLGVGNPADLLAAATLVAAAVIAVAVLGAVPDRAAPLVQTKSRTLRMHAHRTAFLRTRDPDARGRSRPRAPGRSPVAVSD